MNILVNCRGFIGDCFFASSVAKKLKEKYPNSVIHYQIPLVQPLMLLEQNPYIDFVWVGPVQKPFNQLKDYELIINIPEVNQAFPATLQFQAAAGIEDQSVEFQVYTVPKFDIVAKQMIGDLKQAHEKKIVGWQRNWEYKAYQCTPELLANRIGAPHRDIDKIIHQLEEWFIMVPIGFDRHVSQYDPEAADAEGFAKTASVVKHLDYFIGSEGGLQNLGVGVGTKTIITTDFIAQLYWKNGHVKQIEVPMMGSAVYAQNDGHSHLHPCIKDSEIASKIKTLIDTNTSEVFDWTTKFF